MDPCSLHLFTGSGDWIVLFAGFTLGLILGVVTLEIWLRKKFKGLGHDL